MSSQYWASKDAKSVVTQCLSNKSEYYRYINQYGLMFNWLQVYLFKYSAVMQQMMIAPTGGIDMHLLSMKVNDFRNLLMHKASIIKNQAVSWEPQAVNDDVTSLAQTKIAKCILDMYTTHKGYDSKFNDLVQYVVDFGEAFALQLWDSFEGKETMRVPFQNEDGSEGVRKFYEGDTDLRVYQPIDVIRDIFITKHSENNWFIFRDRVNKWDLANKHSEQYDNIVNRSLEIDEREYYWSYGMRPYDSSADLVTCYTFVHKKTSALPEGRIVRFLAENCIFEDSKMTYDDVPWHRMSDSALPETNFSYTDSFDMVMVHDLVNTLWSIIMTNIKAFGVQNILNPKGSDISEMDLLGDLNVIPYDPAAGEPKVLQLLKVPGEVFQTLQALQNMKNTIVGVNATAQGNPPPGVDSGVALNLMQSFNTQYAQGTQESYIKVLSSVGTALINILKQNAREERLIEYTGTAARALVKQFKGKDVNSVARVVAKPGNPATITVAGRTQMAEMMLQAGLIGTQKDLLEVMETGSINVMTDGAEDQLLLALQENEELRDGNSVVAHPFDDHMSHIRQHMTPISDLSIRKNTTETHPGTGAPMGQQVLKATQQHIMDHMKYLNDPNVQPVLLALGYQASGEPEPGQPAKPGAQPAAKQPGATVHNHIHPGQPPKPGQTPSAASSQPALAKPAGAQQPAGQIPNSTIAQAAAMAAQPKG